MNKQTDAEVDNIELLLPSWDQIYSLTLNLAEKIKNSNFVPDTIVGVSRGGWVPARILSDLLENSNITNVATEFYVGIAQTKQEPTITQPISISVKGKKVLVVDDIADTGKSLKHVTAHLAEHGASEVKVATIYYKPLSIVLPDYYEKQTSSWVVFPWERKETTRKVVEKFLKNAKTVEAAKEKLISSGLDREHAQRFINEIFGEKL
ncbi:MAG: phosphoribosyltransferase [Candidatus Bathyarchaeota archaeon]|nr:phosphoribosyltransferase [Candidatus Bathyarchaeota archaeon]